jgi:4-alpha-glucanotransferase
MTRFDFQSDLIRQALALLGVKRLVLAIHDLSFPGAPDEETGRGSPYSRAGKEFLSFVRSLGFNGVQLGPQGKTTRDDPSPYTGTIFTKSVLSLAPGSLADDPACRGLISREEFVSLQQRFLPALDHSRVDYAAAWDITHAAAAQAFERFRAGRAAAVLKDAYARYREGLSRAAVDWFERDAVYEALTEQYRTDDWRRWSSLDQRLFQPDPPNAAAARERIAGIRQNDDACIDRFAFSQFLLDRQHQSLRDWIESIDLRLYGDFQIGLSHQDTWAWRELFLPRYLMGAPPSRSNPEGQPWGFAALDPRGYRSSEAASGRGPALRLIEARIDKMLTEYDGIRIDHPHGIVCPWVYRSDIEDPFTAVQNGARLFSSPDLPDHPALAPFALVDRDQLNPDPACARHADDWIVALTPSQIERYATILDIVLERGAAHGRARDDILCEVLSTWPRPLREVMEARGMGRFRVTQKADPDNPHDVYRSENASPRDWIMVGNHDTPPLRAQLEKHDAAQWMNKRAQMLARRLGRDASDRERLRRDLSVNKDRFCQAMFAELFLGPARSISIFFPDLFGMTAVYNKPGTVSEENWSLRVMPDYLRQYGRLASEGKALDLRASIAMALRARFGPSHPARGLADRLDPAHD